MVIKARSSDLELDLSVRRIEWWISGMDWTGLVTITFCFFHRCDYPGIIMVQSIRSAFMIFVMSVTSRLGYILTWLCL